METGDPATGLLSTSYDLANDKRVDVDHVVSEVELESMLPI